MQKTRNRVWIYVALCLAFVVVVMPFVWMVLGSVKTQGELLASPPTWWPVHPTFDNFIRLFQKLDFGRFFLNSSVVAIIVTAANLLFCSMLGYALAKLNFPGKRVVFVFVIGTLMVPGLVVFIPQFVLVVNLGLANTLTALFLPFLAGAFGVFLMRQFFLGAPHDLLEAARLDGAGEFRIFFKIYLPLAGPPLATLGILTFLGSWNNFLWPLVVASSQSTYTLPVALSLISTGQNATDYGLLLAGATVVVLPILLVFLIFQRHIVEGIASSGIK